jgi:hypothetical protein
LGWEKVMGSTFLLNMTVKENIWLAIFQKMRKKKLTNKQIEKKIYQRDGTLYV